MEKKQLDIPGPCPFSSSELFCPYSIACRWASSHSNPDEYTKQFLLTSPRFQSCQGERAPILCTKTEENSNNDENCTLKKNNLNGWWREDGSIPSNAIGILPGDSILASVNTLGRDLQTQLRKSSYCFTDADTILENHGLRIKRKTSQKEGRNSICARLEECEGQTLSNSKKPKISTDHKHSDCTASSPGTEPNNDDMALKGEMAQNDRHERKIDDENQNDRGDNQNLNSSEVPYLETTSTEREKRKLDFRGKTFLAPLTTVGNLPFRRLCKRLGADITCGEMAMATNLLQGQASEWALLRRHPDEDIFGVQICGGYPDAMARCGQLIEENCKVDFVDINFGCPIDCVVSKQAGSACLKRPKRLFDIVSVTSKMLTCPLTLKMRKGFDEGNDVAHTLIPQVAKCGADGIILHGRTREQRYSRLADWNYITKCAEVAENSGIQLIGNGDVLSWEDHKKAVSDAHVATTYVARGALIKPWIFREIKESKHWDISSSERLDIIRTFASFGLEHWGSDSRGVESTRRFLLEWLSFAHRYVPVGLLEILPQKINHRPPAFVGRNDLETLLSSPDPRDWVSITELVLGPAPGNFRFSPKHKASSYGNNTRKQNDKSNSQGQEEQENG